MYEDKEVPWVWCLVGNIVKQHEYGTEKEVRKGSKHFSSGSKVYIASPNWGDGYEKVIVIGCPRHSRNYIEVVMRFDKIENLRLKRVFNPTILAKMNESEYTWWDNSDSSKESIEGIIVNHISQKEESL